MLKPHVAVARVVYAENKFLVVEETINGKALWNQPTGYLEANEALMQAVAREPWEEMGIEVRPQHFIHMHQWITPDRAPFLRSLFSIELANICATEPHDSDIDCCRRVSTKEIFSALNLRSLLVMEGIHRCQSEQHYPLVMIDEFNWPFTESVK